MSIKDILLIVDTGQSAESRIEFATGLSKRIGARLTGIYARPYPFPYAAGFPDAALVGEIIIELERLDTEQQEKVKNLFQTIVNKQDIVGDWRSVIGDPVEAAATSARYTDLIVTGQRDPEEVATSPWMASPEQVIVNSGRGVLIVPHAGTYSSEIKHILIAWNASREASRAVHESMPFLKSANRVTVALVNPQTSMAGHGADPGVDIATYLARHEVRVDLQRLWSGDTDPAAELLSCAFEIGADLMVAGCRGHSRLQDFLLGGTTRDLLRSMNLPILMAH